MDPPSLVGRSAEWADLDGAVSTALRASGPTVVFLTGQAGIGKTRLLCELLRRRLELPREVIRGYEPERAIPFAAARELLRRHPVALATDAGAATPLLICEAVDRDIGSRGAMVLVVDELPWVDAAALALVHYVLRGAAGRRQPLAVLVGSRPGPALERFRAAATRLLPAARVCNVTLGPLEWRDARALVLEVAPGANPQFVDRVVDRAAGIPSWLELLAQAPERDEHPGLVVRDWIQGLPPDAVEVLVLLGLAERALVLDEIVEISTWSRGRAAEAVETLVECGAAVVSEDGVRPVHGFLAQVVVAEFSSRLGNWFRGRLARWLEQQAGDDLGLLLEALDHRLAAGMPAGALASRLAAHPRRGLVGSRGLERLARVADEAGDDAAATALRVQVAALAAISGQHHEALRRYGWLSDTATDPVVRRDAALAASRAALALGQAEEARHRLDVARELGTDQVAAVELDAHEAVVLRSLEHRTEAGRRLADRALGAARSLHAARPGEAGVRSAYLAALHSALETARFDDDATRIAALAAEQADAARGCDEAALVAAWRRGGLGALMLGDNRTAEARLRQAWEETRRRAMPAGMLEAGAWLALALEAWGRLEEAQAIAAECLELAPGAGRLTRGFTNCIIVDAGVAISQGRRQAGYDALRTALRDETDRHVRMRLAYRLATPLARFEPRAGEEVERLLDDSWACAEIAGCIRCRAELVGRAADALARLGRATAAAAWLERWPEELTEQDRFVHWWRSRGEATVAAASAGEAERRAAAGTLLRLAEETERAGFALETVWVRLDLASVLDDRREAVGQLRMAGACAEERGAVSEQRVAEQRLRALGVRTWRRQPVQSAGTAVLTTREQEVARLVAAGSSNPEIAATIYLSRRTVERHVSNILAKLGLRNRTELAAAFSQVAEHGGPHP